MLACCMTLIGIGNNLWHPTAIPLLARRFPDRKGLVVAMHGMGGNVGDAVAPLVAGFLLTIFTWREVVVINVLPGVLMSIMLMVYLGRLNIDAKSDAEKRAPQVALGAALRGFTALFKNKALVLLSVSSAFRAMTQGSLLLFLPIFLKQEMGYATSIIGACMFGLQAAGLIATPVAGHLSDSVGRRSIIMSSMAMTCVVLLFMAFAGNSPIFVGLVAVLGFFLFAVRSVLQAWVLEAAPKNMGGSAIGFMFATQAVGGAVGPSISGALADHFGLSAVFYFLAVTIVIANMFVFFVPTGAEMRKQKVAAE
jgi:MFS family permease